MRICFTLDEVFRAKTKQFGKIYKKYIDSNISLEDLDLSNDNLYELFPFKNRKEYLKFLYTDYSYEIFGNAPLVNKHIDKCFNQWMLNMSIDDDLSGNEVIIASPYECNLSIGSTMFFLSKIALRVREYYFPEVSTDIWDKCDVLVTSDRHLLTVTPSSKVSIKINTESNTDCYCDLSYDSVNELCGDVELFNKIKDAKELKNFRSEEREIVSEYDISGVIREVIDYFNNDSEALSLLESNFKFSLMQKNNLFNSSQFEFVDVFNKLAESIIEETVKLIGNVSANMIIDLLKSVKVEEGVILIFKLRYDESELLNEFGKYLANQINKFCDE